MKYFVCFFLALIFSSCIKRVDWGEFVPLDELSVDSDINVGETEIFQLLDGSGEQHENLFDSITSELLDTNIAPLREIKETVSVDVLVCAPGYVWSEAQGKCVSFCAADQYYEAKLGKCVYYPCCDLSGDWELSILDSDTMLFTIYQVKINQLTSYLEGEAKCVLPLEQADCYGLLEDKKFAFNCVSNDYTLVLTSGLATVTSFIGFYSYQYTDGNFKNGSFNVKKL